MTNSSNYKRGSTSTKTGIVVHSTGCNNPYIKRYVQPLKTDANYAEVIADIGKNVYGNDWNHKERSGGVHAFVGKNAAGEVETYQVMPYKKDSWGVGRGKYIYALAPYYTDKKCTKLAGYTREDMMGTSNLSSYSCVSFVQGGKTYYVPYKYCGSYNYAPNARIQFEICEDNQKNEEYFLAAMCEAQEYCAHLCREFGWDVGKISSHGESIREGFGQAHEDPLPWMKKFKKDMDWFRAEVKKILDGGESEPTFTPYKVKITANLYIRKGAGTNYKKNGIVKKGGVYTIVDEASGTGSKAGWGKLKSGAGWVALDYTKRV